MRSCAFARCVLRSRHSRLRHAPQSFALSAASLSTALQLAAAGVASAAGALPRGACLASGPFGLLFALTALFAADVPATARFTLLRLPLSDKAFTYAAAARLALGGGLRSALPAACGLLAGAVVAANEAAFARLAVRRPGLHDSTRGVFVN